MSITDTWSDDAFIRLMQDMLNQQKEQEKDNDSYRLSQNARIKQDKTSVSLTEAMYWRKAGDKSMKSFCLDMARRERMNKGEFLANPSELPF